MQLQQYIKIASVIIFLRKIIPGGTDESYGIHVARLAKMPDSLLARAEDILKEYENTAKNKSGVTKVQLRMDFGDESKKEDNVLQNKLKDIDVLNTTPIEALNILYELKNDLKK